MPNKYYNNPHGSPPRKEKTGKNVYGRKPTFGTGMTDNGDDIKNFGNKGKFKNC